MLPPDTLTCERPWLNATSEEATTTTDTATELESMDDLLNEPGGQLKTISRSDVIEGLIVRIDPDELLIDIGLKAEGVVPERELWDTRDEKPKPSFNLGDTVLVYVVQPEGDGPAILSVRRAAQEKVWRATEEMFENGTIIEATIQEFNKGGVLVDVGPRGFVPLSQLTSLRRGPADETEEELNAKLSEVVGNKIHVKIIELDRRRNRLILSERVAEREMRSKRREVLLDELQIGQIRKGIVSNICSFGAFVDLGGADGLAHISELSWSRVESPEELLSPGEEIDVYILSLDRVDKKIALSLRRATKDPWSALESRFQADQIVDGTVTKLAPFGAFVHLEDGVEGLAHSSDLGEAALESINEGNPGKFKILSIDTSRRRIRLQPIEIDTSTPEELDEEGELVAAAEKPAAPDGDSEVLSNEQSEVDASSDTAQESASLTAESETESSQDENSLEDDSATNNIDETDEEDAMIDTEPKCDA